jgi:sulfotransferase famil protein
MPITRLCSPCNVDFNMIIKMENFDSEIKKPLRYARINESQLGWSHKTGTGSNRRIINSYYKKLTLSNVKKLYVKYKRDFQLFGYTPYKYFRLFSHSNSSLV